jgi:hypothetical protein
MIWEIAQTHGHQICVIIGESLQEMIGQAGGSLIVSENLIDTIALQLTEQRGRRRGSATTKAGAIDVHLPT